MDRQRRRWAGNLIGRLQISLTKFARQRRDVKNFFLLVGRLRTLATRGSNDATLNTPFKIN